MRHLVVVLGDQLNLDSSAFDDFDSRVDAIWMAEVQEESSHVWSHKARIALFLSGMRHFRERLAASGFCVDYRELSDLSNTHSLASELLDTILRFRPKKVVLTQPGDWRVLESLRSAAVEGGVELEVRADRHFYCQPQDFAAWAEERSELRLEYFYRAMRRKFGVLMHNGAPLGGRWNFDEQNRESFGATGPGLVPPPRAFAPDEITRDVLRLVESRFAKHPGSLKHFDWPVTPEQARQALEDFIAHRLPHFGNWQDAMWSGEPYLYHSRLSAALNLKLIDPREVVSAAEAAYRAGLAPLASVEGFIRQILGWREYVRGVYWNFMPGYASRNHLGGDQELPEFFWNGETDMNCLRQTIRQTLEFGYAHHIQRLMVTGLYALLAGVKPFAVHEWYLAMYVDAVEWVELPNTLGMSQFADGGVMASKPYVASGKYIQRMSNYCEDCRYHPAEFTGERACPFTTLYWDFLMRHEDRLRGNARMRLQLKNLDRLPAPVRQAIQDKAAALRGAPELVRIRRRP